MVVSVIVMDILIASRFVLSDFHLPVPFLGAVAAMIMLLYQVDNIQWCTIKCISRYSYSMYMYIIRLATFSCVLATIH